MKEQILRLAARSSLLRILFESFWPDKSIDDFSQIAPFFKGKSGLEIGGLSSIFTKGELLPVYHLAKSIDNCNLPRNPCFLIGPPLFPPRYFPGRDFISEATNLARFNDESYDFVLSSHTIEHTANPLKALTEWKRVLRAGGIMLIVCPHKDGTFDHLRPVTPLVHLINDFDRDMGENDTSHFAEIRKLTDIDRDKWIKSREQFEARFIHNFESRDFHHHAFVTESCVQMLVWLGLNIIYVRAHSPCNIIVVGVKPQKSLANANSDACTQTLLSQDAQWRRESPFAIDKTPQ